MKIPFIHKRKPKDVIKQSNHECCPICGLRFNEWFFWPGLGDYCWPCYNETGYIYTRDGKRCRENEYLEEI